MVCVTEIIEKEKARERIMKRHWETVKGVISAVLLILIPIAITSALLYWGWTNQNTPLPMKIIGSIFVLYMTAKVMMR